MRRFAVISRGGTAADYRKAARIHSSAFWGSLVIAAVVWGSFGFEWALLPLALAMLAFYQNRSATTMAEFLEGQRDDPGSI